MKVIIKDLDIIQAIKADNWFTETMFTMCNSVQKATSYNSTEVIIEGYIFDRRAVIFMED